MTKRTANWLRKLWWLTPIRGLIRPLEAIAAIIWMKYTLRQARLTE